MAILVNPVPYQPGDIVTGVISRQEHIVAPRGTIMIRLVGRSGVIYTKRRNNGDRQTTRHFHSKIIIFEESRTIFDGPVHVAPNSLQPQTWPFSFQIPTHVSWATTNLHTKRQERSFLPLDPQAVDGTPVPATFAFHSGHSRDELDAWVEYYLEATLIEEHAEISMLTGAPKTPKIKHARLPLLVNPPPIPPLLNFRILRHTISNQVVQTQRLLPGREGDKLSTREYLSKLFHTSSVPKLSFSVQLEFPTVLQFGNTIPLGIRVIPTPSGTSPSIANMDQIVKLLSFKLRIMAHIRSKIDYDDSSFTEGYEKDGKAYLEVDCNSPYPRMEVVIPCSWVAGDGGNGDLKGLGATTTVQKPQWNEEGEGKSAAQAATRTPKSKSEEAGFGIRKEEGDEEAGFGIDGEEEEDEVRASTSQQSPAYRCAEISFLDLGATMKLRLGKNYMECLGKDRQFNNIILGTNFTTYNISLEHTFKWEVALDIAGEKVNASAEHAVTLIEGWN